MMPTWVGDVVMATPSLRALRRHFPDTHITLLTRPNTLDVLSGGPWMDDVLAWQPTKRGLRRLADPMATAARLRRKSFNWALLLSNSFRSALVARLARIPRRIGYDRDGRGLLLTDRLAPPREDGRFAFISTVHYYNDLVMTLGCPDPGESMELFTTPEDERAVDARLAGWGIGHHHPLVVINPGAAFGSSKLWLPQRYAAVADRLVAERDAQIVITCGPGEEPLAWQIHDTMQKPAHVVDRPRGTLGQLKALIARCDLLLNNDTGPRHFAKALKRPVVTVFGSTHPEWTHTDYPQERIVRIDVECGPCQKKICPLEHHECMTGVTVDMVYEAACALLDGDALPMPLPQATGS